MNPLSERVVQMVVIRLLAVVAVGGLACAAAACLEIDPLGPALIATLIILAKLAVTYRTDDPD
ncbi:hypothetical protein [Geomonas sp.]|uniref:hypothetical protein n=1 Tax=Geomonas sp. TaxID=2651584 RepID=UPI002B469727|nr:hypothetical protein [Geomonas sp.]HJV33722.1 hypothetical protein [Geomonas sp.]